MSKDNALQKLKSFFARNLNRGTIGVARSKSTECVVITEDLENELSPESPVSNRIKTVRDLSDVCQMSRIESHSIEKLWTLLSDLLKSKTNKYARHDVIELFSVLCRHHQQELSSCMRAQLFDFIKYHTMEEDTIPRFEFLKALTDSGKDITHFEERLGTFLKDWINTPEISVIRIKELMQYLVNVIKFNMSFLDEDVVSAMIKKACFSSVTCQKEDIRDCLLVMDSVVCYGNLPPNSVGIFVMTLCKLVNVESFCPNCWKIMRNLLGTPWGHSALLTMCDFMESDKYEDATMRGAVFFVGSSLWGPKKIRSLNCSPNAVLSSFSSALEKRHSFVIYEVLLRVSDLVRFSRFKKETLQSVTWDLIIEILGKVINHTLEDNTNVTRQRQIFKEMDETLSAIETIVDDSSMFCGDKQKFYRVVDTSFPIRSASSVEILLEYKYDKLLCSTNPDWFENLQYFCERHYAIENRVGLKVTALSWIAKVCFNTMDAREEDLIDKVILPYFKNIDTEPVTIVKKTAIRFLVDFLTNVTSKKGHDLLQILERILNKPYEGQSSNSDTVRKYNESEVLDVLAAAEGLVHLFKAKIYHLPSSLAVTTYKIIVRHLNYHYKKPLVLDACSSIRYVIFQCFFQIRANALYHVGFPKADSTEIFYSPYLAVDHRDSEEKGSIESQMSSENPFRDMHPSTPKSSGSGSPLHGSTGDLHLHGPIMAPVVTSITLKAACKLVVNSLKKEKDWKVLELILTQIPNVMENKALILSKHGNDIDYLASNLCALMNLNATEALRNIPSKFMKSDFQAYLFPILTSLVSYHVHLDPSIQGKIIKCLESGVVSKCSKICIQSLSICALEMKDTMHKLLPQVLLALSKISPKPNIAMTVLEFLSTLIHIPRVYASFVQDQYMSIFAIALPYTNPFKFDQYIVSLAHHVIAMWFLKCKLSFSKWIDCTKYCGFFEYRRCFVPFIIKGLEANVWAPFQEESRKSAALELRNDDSSNRKRSSSLTEQTHKRRERSVSGHPPRLGRASSQPVDKSLIIFHQELTETCIDLMKRYAFADCTAIPTRFHTTEFLLRGGHSQTWILGNKLVTITTSGCTQKELRDGLCSKCWLICHKHQGSEDKLSFGGSHHTSLASTLSSRRRHRSEYITSSNGGSSSSLSKEKMIGSDGSMMPISEIGRKEAKDDMHLEQKLQSRVRDVGLDGGLSDESSSASPFASAELSHKPKLEPCVCTCWCQGWAEVLIRQATGNTSWMMRIQNPMGTWSSGQIPLEELSSIYLENVSGLESMQLLSSQTSSTLSSPTHGSSQGASFPKLNFQSQSAKQQTDGSNRDTSEGPDSPNSPDSLGDKEEKNMVKRSNSSPEMTSGWKNPILSHSTSQKEIEEEDENEVKKAGKLEELSQEDDDPAKITVSKKLSEESSPPIPDAKDIGLQQQQQPFSKTGNTSPFRGSCEMIPEENVSTPPRHASIDMGSPDKSWNVSQAIDKCSEFSHVRRDRLSTISVMTNVRNRGGLRRMVSSGPELARPSSSESGIRSGISPAFVFLQLCSQGLIDEGDKPLPIQGDRTDSSLKILDMIPPYETHKIGVVYVGLGQAGDEAAIMNNKYGSSRYREFLQGLGTLIKLSEIELQKVFIGGLAKDGKDGEFAVIWHDDVMQVIFHAATLMPNKENDPQGNYKKLHIGNDHVVIVYNNSGVDFDITTFKSQFIHVCVVIEPLEHQTNRITVKAKNILAEYIGYNEPKIVSDQNLSIVARQIALHSNLASYIFKKSQDNASIYYASNWLERLRHIKRLRNRIIQERGIHHSSSDDRLASIEQNFEAVTSIRRSFNVDDFTGYV